jgi:hypothetical protein
MGRGSYKRSCPAWSLVLVFFVLEWVWVWYVIIEEVLASNPLASSCFCIVYANRELAAVCLRLRLDSLSFLLSKLATVSSFFLGEHIPSTLEQLVLGVS